MGQPSNRGPQQPRHTTPHSISQTRHPPLSPLQWGITKQAHHHHPPPTPSLRIHKPTRQPPKNRHLEPIQHIHYLASAHPYPPTSQTALTITMRPPTQEPNQTNIDREQHPRKHPTPRQDQMHHLSPRQPLPPIQNPKAGYVRRWRRRACSIAKHGTCQLPISG